ncbi:hypothetical protein QVA66_08250 [Staphylococcus chromogenes]|nr:hypothetical protein [Staphylococcus chromogenes]
MIRRFAVAATLAALTIGGGAGVGNAATLSSQSSSEAATGIIASLQGILGMDRPDMNSSEDARPAILPTGENAVKRVLALEEQKAGHKLMNINFKDATHAHITFAPEYDLEKDNEALENVVKALEANGYSVTASR